jgi:hypothetical protein
MKVELSTFRSYRITCIERMKIERSPAARSADAVRTLALLLCCHQVAHRIGEARAKLPFDPGAHGAEPLGLQLGELAADAADLFVARSPVEETQTRCGHHDPP